MKKILRRMAMFPLPSFVFPKESIPLRIFESRYKELIKDVKETGMTFGIPFISQKGLSSIGTEVILEKVLEENSKGEMVITLKGIGLFEIVNYMSQLPGKLYGGGDVFARETSIYTNNPEIMVLVKRLGININGYYGTMTTSSKTDIFDIANKIFLSPEEKYNLATIQDQQSMELYLLKMLKFQVVIKNQEELLHENFSLN
ncbi:MAG TPA: LON peptidase substrate-binding domain-containing protein [Williamwhitmania sp.]|nr:LON peptidase substrate-binding domain-containing protein [Williamwhitmania sp.]